MRACYKIATISLLGLACMNALASTRGYVSSDDTIEDSAVVCLSVGLTASLTNLNHITLTAQGTNGLAGAEFGGADQFDLESNGQVTIIIEQTLLTQDEHQIPLFTNIDAAPTQFVTEPENIHSSIHTLNVEARLGNISAQPAGDYSAEVTLIVTPLIGGGSGCGAQAYVYPTMSTWGTMAWEDLYPNAGDADYNDFVTNFRIEESYSPSNELESIHLAFLPVARGAGYNHSLNLSFDGIVDGTNNAFFESTPVFTGDAQITATYLNLDSGSAHTRNFNMGEDVTIFSNTRSAAGGGFVNVYTSEEITPPRWLTQVDVNLTHNESESTGGLASGEFNYRAYLSVNNTQNDIDLVNINSSNGMVDANGYPFGLLMPNDWYWPSERTAIDEVYPLFSEYRLWLTGENNIISEEAMQWYDHPSEAFEEQAIHVNVNDF